MTKATPSSAKKKNNKDVGDGYMNRAKISMLEQNAINVSPMKIQMLEQFGVIKENIYEAMYIRIH